MEGVHAGFPGQADELMAEVALASPVPATSADHLIRRVLAGDRAAFEGLMTMTEQRVLGVAWRLLGDRDLARDAAQETYLRTYRALGTFQPGGNFPAWICQIAANVAKDMARKRGPFTLPVESLDPLPHAALAEAPVAEEALLHAQRQALVQRALGTLPEGERTALVLRDLEGLSTEEVARALGVKAVTIRSQVASARAKLRATFDALRTPREGGRP